MTSVRIENIVATCPLGSDLDLDRLCRELPESEYDPEHFHALVYRDKKNKGSLLVNNSGIVVAVGFKTEDLMRTSLDDFVQMLRFMGIQASRGPIEVVNLVASVALSSKLDLEQVALALPTAVYDPDQFPGVVVRMTRPKATLLIFGSGRLVCTGASSRGAAEEAIARACAAIERM